MFLANNQLRLTKTRRTAFTLVELLVGIAIFGVLVGMLIPAAQMVREAARRTSCQDRLKNHGLALLNYESSNSAFPHGASFPYEHSWCSEILPYLEQQPMYDALNFKKRWDDGATNARFVFQDLEIFHCPSSVKEYPGKTDYCGISGSWRTTIPIPNAEHNGMLFPAASKKAYQVALNSVTDGTSCTICVSEGVGVLEEDYGFWAAGLNCFSQESVVNSSDNTVDEIASDHPTGANAALCDGAVVFLSKDLSEEVVAALCTRNGYDTAIDF